MSLQVCQVLLLLAGDGWVSFTPLGPSLSLSCIPTPSSLITEAGLCPILLFDNKAGTNQSLLAKLTVELVGRSFKPHGTVNGLQALQKP